MQRKKPRKRTSKDVPAKGRLREMADQLWSLAVKDDWGHRCAICGYCGDYRDLNSHHLIPRQHFKLRYDLRNGICLCRRCHQFCPDRSPHQNAAGFVAWMKANKPSLEKWVLDQIFDGYAFNRTKTVLYFMDEIQRLREYVPAKDFEKICGVKFSRYLEEQTGIDTE